LFSATLDKAVDRLVRKYLHQPVVHQVDTGQASVPLMSHHLVNIAPQHKAELTAELASRPGRTLIFVSTQRGADRVAKQLRRSGILAGALHGGLPQSARTRIMSAFKHGSLPVLVATDVAARGIHVDEVGLVLHADPPNGPKEYLHRAGRTARAGGTGTVVAFALPHQRRELARLTTQAGVRPVMLAASPGDSALAAATGARRASGDAISDADYQRVIAPPPVLRSRSARVRPGDSGVRRPGRRGRRSPASTAAGGSRSRRAF
jgi:superfamily II DNA/RNA helicase